MLIAHPLTLVRENQTTLSHPLFRASVSTCVQVRTWHRHAVQGSTISTQESGTNFQKSFAFAPYRPQPWIMRRENMHSFALWDALFFQVHDFETFCGAKHRDTELDRFNTSVGDFLLRRFYWLSFLMTAYSTT